MRKLISFLILLLSIVANANDLALLNADGKTIYYLYANNQTELMVSFRGSAASNYSNEYSGNVVIPESASTSKTTYPVTSIGYFAFYACSGLTSVTIPNSVTSIGNGAFEGCSGLTGLTIPNSVTSIGHQAFRECSGMTDITISNSVTSIGSQVFYECSSLMSVTIPNSVTSIGNGAFEGCSNLIDVCIPNSVTSIGSTAFLGCSGLNTITIGSSMTSIGGFVFASIPNLTDVYCYAESIPETNSNAFNNSPLNTATLHVPADLVDTYKTTAPWSGFGNIVAIEPPEKCATPTIAFTNGKLQFTCETEGVEFVPSISLIDAEMESNDKVDLFSVYRFNVYAKKEGYADSDMATMDIDFNRLNGDMNHDGQISIADATAIVNIILNDITVIDPEQKFYYSVGTEKVTRTNYTTINNAQYKLEFSEIPETLDLSAISQQQAVILLPEGCMPMIRSASGLVGTTSVSLGNGYMVYTTTAAINGSECTCTVYK